MTDIHFQNLSKAYGSQPVLQNFSACLPAGETVALLGPSGVGKTTLARLLLELEPPDSGQIIRGDMRFGCVFQEDRLCPGLSAEENLRLVLPRECWPGIPLAMEELGLAGEDLKKPARLLSGGQKRRVALARAVLFPSEGLVLDEALKGLDENNKTKACTFLQKRRQGRSLLLITHSQEEAQRLKARCLWLPQAKKSENMGEESAENADIYP